VGKRLERQITIAAELLGARRAELVNNYELLEALRNE
jgi:hypothetical protein